jgi:hypothetical protein
VEKLKSDPKLGQTVRYTKTHEGHLCKVTGLVYGLRKNKNKLAKVSVRCECGAQLLLNPRDYEITE